MRVGNRRPARLAGVDVALIDSGDAVRTQVRWLLTATLAATMLAGCGGDDEKSEKKDKPPATQATAILLKTIADLEEDVSYSDVRHETVLSVISALKTLRVRMRRENLGTPADRERALTLINRLQAVRSTGGPVSAVVEPDDPGEVPPPTHAPIATGPVRNLLGELRQFAESIH